VYAAFEVATTGPQTAGPAVGAALPIVIDYRAILAVEVAGLLLSPVLLARSYRTVERTEGLTVKTLDR
jgi:hypothetical protein